MRDVVGNVACEGEDALEDIEEERWNERRSRVPVELSMSKMQIDHPADHPEYAHRQGQETSGIPSTPRARMKTGVIALVDAIEMARIVLR